MSIFKFNTRGWHPGGPMWELEKMRNHMETIYNALAGGVSQIRKNYTGVFPLVNLAEDENNLYLSAELPGAAADKIEVSVKGDVLSLRGEIQAAEVAEDMNYHRKERESGSFRRNVALPMKVNVDAVAAIYKNGILRVTMPKATEAKAHHITVKTE